MWLDLKLFDPLDTNDPTGYSTVNWISHILIQKHIDLNRKLDQCVFDVKTHKSGFSQ